MKKSFIILVLASSVLFAFTSCKKDEANNNETNSETNNEATPDNSNDGLPITIDGDFSDWAALDASTFVSAKYNPDSPWDAVREIRVCADPDFVYYYIKFNKEAAEEQLEAKDPLHMRICLNTDGEFTSGYNSYFLDAYDFIIEGSLGDGAGSWAEFDGTLHQRTYVAEKEKIDWLSLLSPGHNLVMGKGAGIEYEIMLAREVFNNAITGSPDPNKPIGDVFHTGLRFYGNGWSELSNMPNDSIEKNEHGWAHLLQVTTVK